MLWCSLYGLKQAPSAWFGRFSAIITGTGFSASAHDPTLFILTSHARTLLLLYVDDIIITRDDRQFIDFVKKRLNEQFLMPEWVLGGEFLPCVCFLLSFSCCSLRSSMNPTPIVKIRQSYGSPRIRSWTRSHVLRVLGSPQKKKSSRLNFCYHIGLYLPLERYLLQHVEVVPSGLVLYTL